MGIIPENVLPAVPVVDVCIHNRNAQRPAIGMRVIVADKLDHYRFVVDIAKAPVAVNHAHCMVSQAAWQGKGLVFLFFP